jgi:hypothetical protein
VISAGRFGAFVGLLAVVAVGCTLYDPPPTPSPTAPTVTPTALVAAPASEPPVARRYELFRAVVLEMTRGLTAEVVQMGHALEVNDVETEGVFGTALSFNGGRVGAYLQANRPDPCFATVHKLLTEAMAALVLAGDARRTADAGPLLQVADAKLRIARGELADSESTCG